MGMQVVGMNRARRQSAYSFALPGVTGQLYDDDGEEEEEEAAAAPLGGAAGAEPEVEYKFPAWWFIFLQCPGLVGSLVSGALWGVLWPQLISQMAGEK